MRESVARNPPQLAIQASLAAIVEFASAEPVQALFLTSQAMGAGPEALDARDAGIAEIEHLINEANSQAPRTALIPDVSPKILIGGIYRLLASRLRRGEPGLVRAIDDLSAWVASYERAGRQAALAELRVDARGRRRQGWCRSPCRHPAPRLRTTGAVARSELAASHRERILYAAAQLAEEKGYNATTIADITRLAGVDGRTLLRRIRRQAGGVHGGPRGRGAAGHERDRRGVLHRRLLARSDVGGRTAFTGFLESNPMIAHVGFVEAYAVGPGAVQRVEDSHVTFTIFLQEGYQQKPTTYAALAPGAGGDHHQHLRDRLPGGAGQQAAACERMLAPIAFLALAPFLGAATGQPLHRSAAAERASIRSRGASDRRRR